MSGKPVLVGPFTGGLNNISLAGEAGDSQCVDLMNFELALDQSLTTRPPIDIVTGSLLASGLSAGWEVLGIYRYTDTEWYLFAQKWDGTNWTVGYMLSGDPTAYTVIKTLGGVSNKVTGFVQIQAKCFFSVGLSATINGFFWSKGDASPTDWTALSGSIDQPKGDILIAYKSRLWLAGRNDVASGSRVYFSQIDSSGAANYDKFQTNVDFFDVFPGEGGRITAMLPLNNSIMIWKTDGTYRFSYPATPSKGQQDRISGQIGAANKFSVVDFENYIYVYSQGRVYELINNIYNQINRFVRLDLDTSAVDSAATGVAMSVVDRRLVVQYQTALYSYYIDTRTWSRWRSYQGTPCRWIKAPADVNSSSPSTYYAHTVGTNQNPTSNYILDPTFSNSIAYIQGLVGTGYSASLASGTLTVTKNTSAADSVLVPLNESGGITNYNIPCGSGQQFTLTGTASATRGTLYARMRFFLRNGNTSDVDVSITGAFTATFRAPEGAIQAALFLYTSTLTTIGDTITLNNPNLVRATTGSAYLILKMQNQYSSGTAIEQIDCMLKTKSYDFQMPSNFKKLFWWGVDMKSNSKISAKAIPVAKQLPITWGQLESYTHTQLAAGTWGNPLSFLNISLTVVDSADPTNAITDNGRLFAKINKALRFRQLSFEVDLTTMGNAATGPSKIFSLTAIVDPKTKADAKVS